MVERDRWLPITPPLATPNFIQVKYKDLKISPEDGIAAWNFWRAKNPTIRPDFSRATLRRADLRNANLSRVNFYKANLQRANLSHADLRSAMFAGAIMRGANLSHADLHTARFLETDLHCTVFQHANARKARFRRSFLYNADFSEADLRGADFCRANLQDAKLRKANLRHANFDGANLSNADLSGADLTGASLKSAITVKTCFAAANLTGCHIYGISAWDVNLGKSTQLNLVITEHEPHIQVDDLEVAQFIYLLLNRQKLRNVITTLGQKAVLILGRFTERRELLDGIAGNLRELGYLPIIFDFERPTDRDITETVKILAGLSLFVIADITNPRSVPLELQATVPDYMVPFVTIAQKDQPMFSMFDDLPGKYHWALPLLEYPTSERLLATFEDKVVNEALKKLEEVRLQKALPPARRSTEN